MSRRTYEWEKNIKDSKELGRLVEIRSTFDELNKPVQNYKNEVFISSCPHPLEHAKITDIEISCGVCEKVFLQSRPEFSKEEYLSKMRKLEEAQETAWKKIEELRADCPHPYEAYGASPDEEWCGVCMAYWEETGKLPYFKTEEYQRGYECGKSGNKLPAEASYLFQMGWRSGNFGRQLQKIRSAVR